MGNREDSVMTTLDLSKFIDEPKLSATDAHWAMRARPRAIDGGTTGA
jgi:hypothetical protein